MPMRAPLFRTLLVAGGLSAVLAAGLVAQESARPVVPGRSTPAIAGVMPNVLTTAAKPQDLTINGRDFQPALTLTVTTPGGGTAVYAGEAIQLPTQLSFRVSVVFATAGRYSLVVTNPDGGVSSPYPLDVLAKPTVPPPVIDQLLPASILKDQQAQDLTVKGQRFESGLRVIVTNPLGAEVPDVIVRDVTASSFTVNVRLDMAGPHEIVVVNPSGAASNIVSFIVK